MSKRTGAVVVFSGGQDSTTCLFWAKEHYENLLAVTFDYGQRHATEVRAALKIAELAEVEHMIIDLTGFGTSVRSALTSKDIEVKADGGHQGLPSTFVPGRNVVFGAIAGGIAVSRGWCEIVLGVCETDYSGYPDCRKATMDALSESIRLGNGLEEFCIATPLMYLSKAATVKMALELGPLAWEAVGLSVTCYQGHVPGCGKCPSCLLREKGFAEANAEDPALKRAVRNGIKWGTP